MLKVSAALSGDTSCELVGSPCVGVYVKVVGVWPDDRLQSPTSDGFCSLLNGLLRYPIGRRHKRNFVTCLQIGWLYNLLTLMHFTVCVLFLVYKVTIFFSILQEFTPPLGKYCKF